jgi:hypothetical protein
MTKVVAQAAGQHDDRNGTMSRGQRSAPVRALLAIIVIILLIGALPTWPYSASWGYYPSGGLGTILIIVLILMLVGII